MLGPTASGKSQVALELAESVGAEIVSVDSMQVYRGMDIGTAKPTPADRGRVTHHMIDVADPSQAFTVAEFQQAGRTHLAVAEEGVPVVVVGGSGLHFRSLVDPLEFPPSEPEVRAEVEALPAQDAVVELLDADPGAASHVDLANPRRVARALEVLRITGVTPSERAAGSAATDVRAYRPRIPFVAVGLDPGDGLPGRATARFDAMLESGLLDEVAGLAGRLGSTASQAVGYRQLAAVVEGTRPLDEGRRRGIDATTALAGRQRTFFRRDPRIRWVEWDDDPAVRLARARRLAEEAGWTS